MRFPLTPLRSTRVRACVATAAVTALSATTLALAAPAAANPPGPSDPMGTVTSIVKAPGGVKFTGWVYDKSARTTNVQIASVVDGKRVSPTVVTSLKNAAVTKKYKTGPTPGFTTTVPVGGGRHTVCLLAKDVGKGVDILIRCVATPLGTRLTASQVAARSPRGAILHSWANPHSVHLQGWATDPDYTGRRNVVVLYVDNRAAATVSTDGVPSPRPAAAGSRSKFDILVHTGVGTHVGCVWVVNVGIGHNRFLGCRTMDNRGHASSGAVRHPSINAKVAAEAKKHIGQPYVWGATGPKRFDCSGLVMYSYKKFGYSTPRVSQDQFRAARLIPASRAVAGDPVFYFDQRGDVYHVGIYLGPGKTVAAIDPAEGVNYQRIWDPSSTAYGSFTHT